MREKRKENLVKEAKKKFLINFVIFNVRRKRESKKNQICNANVENPLS